MRRFGIVLVFLASSALGQQWTLQPWVEVFGTVAGQELGRFVTGLTPGPGFPYRAAVSRVGVTGFYGLSGPTDTAVQMSIVGGREILQGDLDNDGILDYVVRTRQNAIDSVKVYKGTPNGIDAIPMYAQGADYPADLIPQCLGDLDGDGIQDLVVVDYGYGVYQGRVNVLWGPLGEHTAMTSFLGDSSRCNLGQSSVIGDINADGKNDLIVRGFYHRTPPDSDYINIYWGTGSRTIDTLNRRQIRTGSIRISPGLACFDVNGDGIKDLLWNTLDTVRRVSIHFGRSNFQTDPDLRLQNPGVGDFGFVIANAGDMNGDGHDDIAIGCPYASIISGFVFVFSGGPTMDDVFDAAVGKTEDSYFGASLASVGDVTGDGLADLIVGRPRYAFREDKGYWAIFKGSPNIPVSVGQIHLETPSGFSLGEPYPNPFNPRTTIGYSVPSPGSALVRLSVYDALGKEVVLLVEKRQGPGDYTLQFDGSTLASGVYFCRMKAATDEGVVYLRSARLVLAK